MADAILRIKTVMDVGDVVSNVGTIQKALGKLKLPDNLKDNLNKNISSFYKEYEKYQKKLTDGLKTQGDFNQVEKSLNRMKTLYSEIGKDAAKAIKIDPEALFNLDEGKFKDIASKIEQTLQKLSNLKIDKKPFEDAKKEIEGLSKNQKIVGDEGILTRMMGHIETGEIGKAKQEYTNLINEVKKAAPIFDEMGNRISKPGTFNAAHYQQLQSILSKLGTSFSKAGADAKPLEEELNRLQQEMAETVAAASKDLVGNVSDYNKQAASVEKVTDSLKRMHEEEYSFNRQAQDIDRQIQSYFGLSQMIRKVGEIAKDAFATVKELDAAMVETAVVTNFDVGDMWNMLPTYTANANQLGSTIKDVYEAATLYYQQGLNQAQSMGLANETLKMARIGGLQAADATNMMTAALRGFNMEINQVSAKRINDVYSELAAITAADTKEIGSAMERTASIADSANMQFETTSAFLAQMIETTREAPENLGTAMKTIIARFQEMKQDPTKLVDSEGVALDANKIDTALKTIGVDLKNQKGEFRDLDTVFLEISEKWDSLTQGQQRYIATVAAGSRQQSRFIAMMQNYDRVKELVDAANNSAGASQKQFEKTLDSMSSKLNRLKNAWDQFTMGLMNNQILKGGVDALTGFFTIVNKIFDVLTKPFPDPFGGLIKSALTLTSTLALLNFGKKGARGAVMAGVGWWKNEGKIVDNFKGGWGVGTRKPKEEKQQVEANKIYQQQLDKKLTSSAKARFVETPVVAKAYLQKLDAAGLDPRIQAEIEKELDNPITEDVKVRVNALIDKDAKGSKDLHLTDNDLFKNSSKINQFETRISSLTGKITNAGSALQQFGASIGGPFGSALSTAGSLLMGLGATLDATATSFMANFTASIADATGKEIDSVATLKLALAQTTAATTAKALGAALWASLGPLALIAAAIGVAVIAYKGFDALHVSKKEELEATTDAAAKASEAFDSAKQETSELNDAISRIRENESAFDNLVAGTADFNEQMVTANEQITELLQKYPMLNDYVSTDKNGLMHISEEGLKAVKDYQKQIQARASATNIIQSADLAAIENQQKAEKLRKKSFGLTEEEIKKNKEDAQLLDDRAKAEVELARRNAARTILNGKEIKDVEAMSAIYANLYEEKRKVAEAEVNGMSKKDIAQQYADYHGYTYNKSTNKMKDTEGNDVDFDDKVIKDEVIENTVLLDFEANAESLDSILTNLDNKFSETLGNVYKDSDNFVSDLLSSNIETNTDLLKDVLSDSSTQLSDLVHSMSDEELAAILGVTQSEVSNNLDTYQNQAINLLTERANSIVEAQSQSYAKLGEMMARASDVGLVAASTNTIQSSISKQIAELSTQQANTLSTIGQTLEQNVGPEAMETFIREASGIYLQKNEQLSKEFDGILNDINWESPTSRLEGYHNAINSTNEDIQNWGKSMRASADEANILGDAFTEFLSKDWEELSQNADNFKNSMGEIDNVGIMAAAKESKTLNSLLESGEVSATGLAKALQAVEDGSLSEVNSTVLELLSSMNRLGDAALEAHEVISNFDPGIDFGEGEDFVKENAEKAKEYYDNGEWGNQQLQNYIKLAAGTDKWNETLRANHGNLQETTDDLMKYVTTFSDGFQPAWDQMISGKNINGKSLSGAIDDAVKHFDTTGVSKELGDKFKEVSVSWDDEGFMQIDVGDLTTQELETYFQEIYGVSKEYAQLLMQDLANYDGEVSAALAKNDLQATVGDQDFQSRHLDREGNLTFSNADLQAFEAAGGSIKELEQAAGKAVKTFDVVDEEGNRLKVNTEKLQEFDKVFGTGKGRIDSLITDTSLQGAGGKLDLSKLIDVTKTKAGFDEQQSLDAAYRAYQRASNLGKSTLYDGVELEKGLDREGWEAAIAEATETSKWVPIGEAIAQGFMNVINGEKPSEDSALNSGQYSGQKLTKEEYSGFKEEVDATAQKMAEIDQTTEQGKQKVAQLRQDFVDANMDGLARLNTGQFNEINGQLGFTKEQIEAINQASMALTQEKQIPITADGSQATGEEEVVRSSWQQLIDDGATNPLIIEADSTQAETKVEEVRSSYGQLVNDGKTNPFVINTKTEQTPQKESTSKPEDTKSTYAVDVKGQEKVDSIQTKLQELNTIVNKGGTYNLNVTGAAKIQKAAKAAKDLSASKDSKTISVKTGKADTSSVKVAKASISKTTAKIKVGADTSKALTAAESARKKIDSKKATINVSTSVKGKNVDIYVTKHVKEVTSHTGGYITTSGVLYRAKGGNIIVPSFKKKGTDTVPAMLTPGEYVQNRDAVNYFGIDFMRKINHKDLSGALQAFGSAANGRYGRLGPKGKGGLTLTGEKGFEIAWLPSENRSMILGTEGPQMLSLPSDAIIYTHEQSKKIIKQKSIPAGSHAKQNRMGRRRRGGSGGSGSGSGSGSKGKSKSKNKNKKKKKKTKNSDNKPTINNFSMQEVIRFNIDQKLTKLTNEIAKKSKEIEKVLAKIGTRYSDIVNSSKEQINSLKGVKSYNEKLRDSYAKQLGELRKQKGMVSWTDSKGKSHDKKIKIKNYLNADGSINYNNIKKLKTRAEREAVFNFVSGLSKPLVDGMENAQKAIEDAEQQIAELGQKISETFYQWENELTEIYHLTQRIGNASSLSNRFTSQVDLEIAKLKAGFGDIAQSISITNDVLLRNNKSIQDQIKYQYEMVAARKRELDAALSYQDELDRYNRLKNDTSVDEATRSANEEWAYGEYLGALLGNKYVKNLFKDIDGHIEYDIDWKGFENDNLANPYSKTDYEAIKKYLDTLNSAETEYNNSIKEATDLFKETYDTFIEYQDFIAEMEDTLIDSVEELIEEENENAKTISDSINNTLKDLLDDVKRKLDERRQQEDNAKTEKDISQMQQRLAALRTDTSGGNQVEIAQLEKEIAEAQQDYQRSLEDQLLDKLQEQADKAAEQRERQIELSEVIANLTAENNKALVNMWLSDPLYYKEDIKKAWLESQGYDEKGTQGQYNLEKQFESEFLQLMTAIEQTGFGNRELVERNENTLVGLLTYLTEGNSNLSNEIALDNNALLDLTAKNTTSILTEIQKQKNPAELKKQGADAKSLKMLGFSAKQLIGDNPNSPIYSGKELREAGYTAKEVKEGGINNVAGLSAAGYSAKEIKSLGFNNMADYLGRYSYADLKNAGFDAVTFKNNNVSYANAKAAGYSMWDLSGIYSEAAGEIDKYNKEVAYQNKLNRAISNKTTSWQELQSIQTYANAAGHGARTWIPAFASKDGAGGVTWKEIFQGLKGHFDKYRMALSFSNSSAAVKAYNEVFKSDATRNKTAMQVNYAEALRLKKTAYSYKTGGLADYTGPAWLDGTPSKPELVLNAADTQNFLVLKDVLSKAVRSSNSTSNSYGDETYEININVDHINNDYDVDRMAERVKKIIVKDAGYRNVTQVRNFR